MTKKLMMMAVAVAAAMSAMADMQEVGSYTWTYRINGDTAEICVGDDYDLYPTYASPKPTGAVIIPSTLGGNLVTSIENYVFYGCSKLTSVTIHKEVIQETFESYLALSSS